MRGRKKKFQLSNRRFSLLLLLFFDMNIKCPPSTRLASGRGNCVDQNQTGKKKLGEQPSPGSAQASEPGHEAAALLAIRAETALSRFPLHRIAKKVSPINIELKNQAAAIYWNVSYNNKYGQAGPLAYKIDTLLVNRRIEQSGRPTPKVIRLGTLAAIAQELGTTSRNWEAIRLALAQNATATITAKLSYFAQDKSEKWLEAIFNRYNVVFTGETLPNGTTADGVFIVLSDIYQEIINTAVFRPLDYDYMKSLPPAAQRFYEIVSYQVYAAVHRHNPRARLLYSEYCLLSTATRYFEFDRVKKQMYKVLRPHLASGYLGRVEYEHATNDLGQPDWLMLFTPGPNANREYREFSGAEKTTKPIQTRLGAGEARKGPLRPIKGHRTAEPIPPIAGSGSDSAQTEPDSAEIGSEKSGSAELIELLVEADLNRSSAERFARERPEVCYRQLKYLAAVSEFRTSRGAYLRRAIEGDFGAPADYARIQAQNEAKSASERLYGELSTEESREEAREGHQDRFYGPYLEYTRQSVGEAQRTHPEAFMEFCARDASERLALTSGPFAGRLLTQSALEAFDQEPKRLERCRDFLRKQGIEIFSFWEWDKKINEKSFEES